ncbi:MULTISPECIES: stage II sporulation protein B [Bacillus]|uniref:Stage II sporulation protein B n=2 Tax=Bacillus cereus group TaxID=86661 RepID=A0A2A7DBR5_BACAN|nr:MULTISPECIES: stage II sporulation protein B [Bacillus]MCP1165587.1 stage II sporulation protein B [Bacillus sp. 1813sda1]MDC7975359.1 stage II sporulation protein B [Bacillus sp. BLCC-B18]OTW66361.1 stage II sporulation protein B [Bacillus thuringiensis serovar coreanensis]OTX43361.1 stage II sporulation protein B [Bacillus thuringiensis serovar sooncheon]OTX51667.1 stage II sporulation protein B [Bacillus thuringiensis serovar guiyangiensis]
MDKQSRTISVKVNGTEAKYEEKKDEFEWMVVESERPKNVVPFQKAKLVSTEKTRKKWSNTLIAIVATAIIIGTAFGMGMLQLLKGQGATGGSEVTASKQTRNEESKVGGTAEQTPAQKEEKPKAQTGTSLNPMKLFFVQGGIYSSEEKGQAALEEWKGNGGVAALKPSGDKYALVVGIASDEQGVNQLMTQYKNDNVSVLKKDWDIADKALLKDDKEVGSFLTKVQPLYTHLAKYTSSVQGSGKSNAKDIGVIEKEWKAIEKEGKSMKQEEAKKLYMYTSVAVQTVKDGKGDKESLAKLNQVIIDGMLSYEKIVSQKAK